MVTFCCLRKIIGGLRILVKYLYGKNFDKVGGLSTKERDSCYDVEVKKSNKNPRHPIRIVARRTGMKPDLIRAWERRYGAVEPQRSETGRRLYTDEDIRRYQLLQRAVAAGRGIRLVAGLTDEALERLVAEDKRLVAEGDLSEEDDLRVKDNGVEAFPPPASRVANLAPRAEAGADDWMGPCLESIQALDEKGLENHLLAASVALSRVDLLEGLLAPMMTQVGELWRRGILRPVHEHLATAVLRTFIGNLKDSLGDPRAPHVLVTTPSGQLHEIGALLAAICAASEGCNVTYLGCDLPAEEIAAGARQKGSVIVALSATYPPDDPRLPRELVRLHGLVPPSVRVIVGGRAIRGYRDALAKSGIELVDSLQDFRRLLEGARFSKVG